MPNHDFGIPSESSDAEQENTKFLTKKGIGEAFMTWESLRRSTKWTERVYEFEWGLGGERKSYTWLRTKPTGAMGIGDIKELELREGNRGEAENGGECVTKWVRGKEPKTLKRGSVFVKKGGLVDERTSWESVVIITFLMILEIFVRKGGG